MSNWRIVMVSIKQQSLEISSSKVKNKDYFRIYYKLVSSEGVYSKNIFSNSHKKSLLRVFSSFTLSEFININTLKMKSNTELFIRNIFENPSENLVSYLLNDFSEYMNTNMREKNNYIVLILFENKLILAHTKMGEISINTNFKVFERLIDKDNIMRVAFFEYCGEVINVAYYEKNKSKFFIDWLGLNEKKLFYSFNGQNKFFSSINGVPIVLEISDEDFDKFMNDDNISISKHGIKFSNPIGNLRIDRIMRYNKSYLDYTHFKRDFISIKYDIMYYKDKYHKINSSLTPYIQKIWDCEDVVKSDSVYVKKENVHLKILFCNEFIDMDVIFINNIFSAIMNNEDIKLLHVGDEISEEPIIISNLKIYNNFCTELTNPLLEYLNEYKHSHPFRKILLYVIFKMLYIENDSFKLRFLFKNLIECFGDDFELNSFLKEDSILELKSGDFFSGDNNEIIDKLIEDIPNKLNDFNLRIYLLGYDEKSRVITPFLSQQYNDDRIEAISKKINKKLKLKYLNIFKIPIDIKQCVFIMVIRN